MSKEPKYLFKIAKKVPAKSETKCYFGKVSDLQPIIVKPETKPLSS